MKEIDWTRYTSPEADPSYNDLKELMEYAEEKPKAREAAFGVAKQILSRDVEEMALEDATHLLVLHELGETYGMEWTDETAEKLDEYEQMRGNCLEGDTDELYDMFVGAD